MSPRSQAAAGGEGFFELRLDLLEVAPRVRPGEKRTRRGPTSFVPKQPEAQAPWSEPAGEEALRARLRELTFALVGEGEAV